MKNTRKIMIMLLAVMMIVATLPGMVSAGESVSIATSQNEKVKVLIGFKDMPGPAEEALVRAFGGTVSYTYTLIPTIAAELPAQAVEALARNPKIALIEPDLKVYQLVDEYDNAWGMERIGERTAHDNGYFGADVNGTGIKVAVIDSGIDSDHPELAGIYAGGYDFVNRDDDPDDIDGHGTHVAGIIAAKLDGGTTGVVGAAPGIQLYALKALEGGTGSLSDILAAVNWCAGNGILITNNSYGTSADPGVQFQAAYDAANEAGILQIASAGNSGNPSGKGDSVGYPAKYASVMAVAASDSADKRASFSSTGPDVEIMAPGVNIFSTYINGTYKALSGTSMASPHVVGVAAQVWAADLTKSNDYVRGLLKSTAENLGLLVTQQGAGLVRANLATNATNISEPPPPPPPPVVADPIVTVSSDKLVYSGNVWANIKVGITDGDQPIAGASVSLMVTTPDLVKTYYSGTTDSSGQVVFKYRFLKTSTKGMYRADAYYSWTGGEETGSTSFEYN